MHWLPFYAFPRLDNSLHWLSAPSNPNKSKRHMNFDIRRAKTDVKSKTDAVPADEVEVADKPGTFHTHSILMPN